MDSLTQLALGAAVGEIVLGKKAGNRAMLWGAIGGTIPDLDILANFVTDEMSALAFHRGITHSFLFAFTAPLAFGWLTEKFYNSGLYKKRSYKAGAMTSWFLLLCIVGLGLNAIPKVAGGDFNLPTILLSLGFIGMIMFFLWRNYYRSDLEDIQISWKEWAWLFFWSIFTHPLLDACTAYGTQLFQPFSDYRVAFNNISVVDPIYTIPLLIGISIAGFLSRKSSKRRYLNYAGIILSCLYLSYSFYNKYKVDQIFENSLIEQEIAYTRYRTSPTILTNILWLGVAETQDTFYLGMYALTDKEPRVKEFVKVAQNKHLLDRYKDDESIRILKWFSDGYYGVLKRSDGQLQFNDLRFGFTSIENPKDDEYVFKFILKEEKDGSLAPYHKRDTKDIKKALDELFTRIKGI